MSNRTEAMQQENTSVYEQERRQKAQKLRETGR